VGTCSSAASVQTKVIDIDASTLGSLSFPHTLTVKFINGVANDIWNYRLRLPYEELDIPVRFSAGVASAAPLSIDPNGVIQFVIHSSNMATILDTDDAIYINGNPSASLSHLLDLPDDLDFSQFATNNDLANLTISRDNARRILEDRIKNIEDSETMTNVDTDNVTILGDGTPENPLRAARQGLKIAGPFASASPTVIPPPYDSTLIYLVSDGAGGYNQWVTDFSGTQLINIGGTQVKLDDYPDLEQIESLIAAQATLDSAKYIDKEELDSAMEAYTPGTGGNSGMILVMGAPDYDNIVQLPTTTTEYIATEDGYFGTSSTDGGYMRLSINGIELQQNDSTPGTAFGDIIRISKGDIVSIPDARNNLSRVFFIPLKTSDVIAENVVTKSEVIELVETAVEDAIDQIPGGTGGLAEVITDGVTVFGDGSEEFPIRSPRQGLKISGPTATAPAPPYDETLMYLVGTASPYEQYVVNETGDLVAIGAIEVDLSDYPTREEVYENIKGAELEAAGWFPDYANGVRVRESGSGIGQYVADKDGYLSMWMNGANGSIFGVSINGIQVLRYQMLITATRHTEPIKKGDTVTFSGCTDVILDYIPPTVGGTTPVQVVGYTTPDYANRSLVESNAAIPATDSFSWTADKDGYVYAEYGYENTSARLFMTINDVNIHREYANGNSYDMTPVYSVKKGDVVVCTNGVSTAGSTLNCNLYYLAPIVTIDGQRYTPLNDFNNHRETDLARWQSVANLRAEVIALKASIENKVLQSSSQEDINIVSEGTGYTVTAPLGGVVSFTASYLLLQSGSLTINGNEVFSAAGLALLVTNYSDEYEVQAGDVITSDNLATLVFTPYVAG
jgi:hypothetical protein